MFSQITYGEKLRTLRTAISICVLFGGCVAPVLSQTWQQLSSPQIELGIRDKHGQKGSYIAEFIVVDAKGKSAIAKVRVKEGQFGTVFFPQDFKTHFAAGKYSWSARVDGKAVIKGQFVYESLASGERVTIMR